ncbi:MAG: mechanosensitive ion channel family protein [Clostridiales bacterium]|nr:mechanosensitive ion channel family protein [Clostridiales bacterium]
MQERINAFFDAIYQSAAERILTSLFLAGLILLAIFSKPVSSGLLKLTGQLFFRRREEARSAYRAALQKPLQGLWAVLGVYAAFLLLFPQSADSGAAGRLLRIAVIVLITWAVLNAITHALPFFLKFEREHDDLLGTTATKFLTNILKAIVLVCSGVIIISELGYNITGLLTGVGLGGLTIALAAQETASNLFGGFIIIFDKPFQVGDWITADTVDGVVEDITVRSTKIRTFADSVVTVPNATLANAAITNWSKMNKRQVKFEIGLTYDTPTPCMKQIAAGIQSMLEQDADVHPETIRVRFDAFQDSSLNLSLYFFTNAVDAAAYTQIKERINYAVKDIVEEAGAQFAFPSRSLYIEQDHSKR